MEVNVCINKWGWRCLLMLALPLLVHTNIYAQFANSKCEFRDGEFYIELNKKMLSNSLDSFIVKYNLSELNLKKVMQTSNVDTLRKLGWKIRLNNQQKFIITKPLSGSSDIKDPVSAIINSEKHPTVAEMFPAVDEHVVFGYNRFKNKYPFAVENNIVRFFLRKKTDAKTVILAGSFNNWSPSALSMKKTDSGWIADVKLTPGKYWYKFIVDGNWMYDSDNLARENDGLGNINSILFKENTVFKLEGFRDAKRVHLAGSFNSWQPNELQMNRTPRGWELPVYLANGTHTYKFLVNGNWVADPKNNEQLPDGRGGYNSVIKIGKPYRFTLNGFTNAKEVVLTGTFNEWRKDELKMKKTAAGWQLEYALRPGNYEYVFLVDGKQITDPSNPLIINSDVHTQNSYLIIGANYTFRLKMPYAKSVYLAGDFNNWSPNSLAMIKHGDEWIYSVHLAPGKHKYKYLVDGKWITDPGNKQWEQNEYGTGNSVIWIDSQASNEL
jgi:1,4-alpha-glucan branching enzyme